MLKWANLDFKAKSPLNIDFDHALQLQQHLVLIDSDFHFWKAE